MNDFLASLVLRSPIPWWVVVLAAVLAALVFVRSLRGQMREVPAPRRYSIAALRLLIIAALAVCVLRPAMPRTAGMTAQGRPRLYLFVDCSHSMQRADCGMGPVTRFEVCVQNAEKLARAAHGYDVQMRYFDAGVHTAPPRAAHAVPPTDLTAPLEYLLAHPVPPASQAVIFSDGAHTANADIAAQCARYFAAGNTPVHCVGFPPVPPAPRLAVARMALPAQCAVNDRIQCDTEFLLYDLISDATATLYCDGERISEHTLAATAQVQRLALPLQPAAHGRRTYTVRVTAPGAEDAAASASVDVQVLRRTFRVLYLEGTAVNMYDGLPVYRNVPDALERAGDITCDVMVDPEVVRYLRRVKEPVVDDPRHGYPLTLEGLCRYDVIINSDIPRHRFTKAQIDHTAEFVEQRGGGYVMIGGETAFARGGWHQTRMERISPVEMGEARYMDGAFVWEFTPEGFRHPILQLADDPRENERMLRSMPPFYGYNGSRRVKPTAVLLATHPSRRTEHGDKMPMLAVQELGRGRCMAFMTDTTWLWGMDFERHWGTPVDAPVYQRNNACYARFWQNAVRWLGRNSRRHYLAARYLAPAQPLYTSGDTVRMLYHDPGAFAQQKLPRVLLHIAQPHWAAQSLEMTPLPGRDAFAAEFVVAHTGQVTVSATRSDEKTAAAVLALQVRPDYRELVDVHPRMHALAAIAAAGRGACVSYADDLPLPPAPTRHERQAQETDVRDLWTSPWTVLVVLALCTTEWILRRLSGMA